MLTGFGEGATSTGDWHEAMNFAAVFKAPVVFLCENNQWAISVPMRQQVAGRIADRAEGYGFPGVRVDGTDVLTVYAVVTGRRRTSAARRRTLPRGGADVSHSGRIPPRTIRRATAPKRTSSRGARKTP